MKEKHVHIDENTIRNVATHYALQMSYASHLYLLFILPFNDNFILPTTTITDTTIIIIIIYQE